MTKTAQPDVLAILQKLPPESFDTLPSNSCQLIGIHRGVPGYTPLRILDTPEAAREMADQLNHDRGVTPAQASAMTHGSMFGWHTPSADPDDPVNQGGPRS